MRLQSLGVKYNTDKVQHTYKNKSYLDIYEKYFEKKREDVKLLVEIGVKDGSSVKMWKEYFPNAKILGIDIDPRCKMFEEDRIEVLIGNQNDEFFLKQLSEKIVKADIIIDDGSHITQHQIKTFNFLHKNLNAGGFYIIEDLRNSYEEYLNHHDIRSIWPGMKYNIEDEDLKNYRQEFVDWVESLVKKLDFHDEKNTFFSIHHYPMILILENT